MFVIISVMAFLKCLKWGDMTKVFSAQRFYGLPMDKVINEKKHNYNYINK